MLAVMRNRLVLLLAAAAAAAAGGAHACRFSPQRDAMLLPNADAAPPAVRRLRVSRDRVVVAATAARLYSAPLAGRRPLRPPLSLRVVNVGDDEFGGDTPAGVACVALGERVLLAASGATLRTWAVADDGTVSRTPRALAPLDRDVLACALGERDAHAVWLERRGALRVAVRRVPLGDGHAAATARDVAVLDGGAGGSGAVTAAAAVVSVPEADGGGVLALLGGDVLHVSGSGSVRRVRERGAGDDGADGALELADLDGDGTADVVGFASGSGAFWARATRVGGGGSAVAYGTARALHVGGDTGGGGGGSGGGDVAVGDLLTDLSADDVVTASAYLLHAEGGAAGAGRDNAPLGSAPRETVVTDTGDAGAGARADGIAVMDVDGDGRNDIVFALGARVVWRRNVCERRTPPPVPPPSPPVLSGTATAVAIAAGALALLLLICLCALCAVAAARNGGGGGGGGGGGATTAAARRGNGFDSSSSSDGFDRGDGGDVVLSKQARDRSGSTLPGLQRQSGDYGSVSAAGGASSTAPMYDRVSDSGSRRDSVGSNLDAVQNPLSDFDSPRQARRPSRPGAAVVYSTLGAPGSELSAEQRRTLKQRSDSLRTLQPPPPIATDAAKRSTLGGGASMAAETMYFARRDSAAERMHSGDGGSRNSLQLDKPPLS